MNKSCSNCGEELKSSDVFCPFCSNPVVSANTTSTKTNSQKYILCPNCSIKNKVTSKYCMDCGNNLIGLIATESQSEVYDTAASSGVTYGSYSTKSSDGTQAWYKPPERTRSRGNPVQWVIWSGWGLWILFRVIFEILFFAVRIAALSKK
ncbi:MAG: zinc ribbon domain-containing protein [Candidatus Heimdallarchaeota archaeon]